ncbi:hypothetical protein BH10PSE19_BH10PSE19_22060 [soil metagenome]
MNLITRFSLIPVLASLCLTEAAFANGKICDLLTIMVTPNVGIKINHIEVNAGSVVGILDQAHSTLKINTSTDIVTLEEAFLGSETMATIRFEYLSDSKKEQHIFAVKQERGYEPSFATNDPTHVMFRTIQKSQCPPTAKATWPDIAGIVEARIN